MKMHYKLQIGFVEQAEWSPAHMWLEMSFGALGGALFIVAALLNFVPGVIAGYLILMAGKGLILLIEMAKPGRFLNVLKRPFQSWISFGSWAFLAFSVFGLIYLILALAGNMGGLANLMKFLGLLAAGIVIVYEGFVLSASAAIAAWQGNSLLPPLFCISALAPGAAITIALGQSISAYVVVALFILLVFAEFSYVKGLASSVQAAKVSADELTGGSLKTAFIWMAVIVGAVVPLLIGLLAITGTSATGLWWIAALCSVLGVFALRYSILKAGVYAPVL
jgi:polysulfide reductase chain C